LTELVLGFSLFFEKNNADDQFRSRRNFIHMLILHLFSPLAYFLRKLLVNDANYFAIDQTAVKLLGSTSQALIDMLNRAQSYANNQALDVPASMAHLFVVNPLTKPGWGRYFQAQPSTRERTSRLLGESQQT
jgi:Zn-dependent protease with chaperone function